MKKILTTLFNLLIICKIFAQGYYVEMKMTATGSKEGMNGTMKSYSQDGNSRSEINMNIANAPAGIGNIAMLTLKDKPETVYMLNEKEKTYSEFSSANDNEDMKDYPKSEYEIIVVGKEKVNSYNCTHIRVKRKGSSHETEMWTTTELTGYAEFSKMKTKYTGKANMLKALEEKGAAGFPVRIKSDERGHSMQIDLVKAEKRNNPASLFSLAGYTKTENPIMPGGPDMQELMKKMQNMSAAEREAWMKRMQEQYQNHPPH